MPMITIAMLNGQPRPWFVPPEPIVLPREEEKPQIEINLDKWEPSLPSVCEGIFAERERKCFLENGIMMWNAHFIKDLSEEQQLLFINTLNAIEGSMLRLNSTPWGSDNSICGAVYGQNLAKIEMTSRMLGGKYADKMKEVLDWYAENTILRGRAFGSLPSRYNVDFQEFENIFAELGNYDNPKEFKQQLKVRFEKLTDALGEKFAKPIPHFFGNIWTDFIGFLVKDWDNYISKLMIYTPSKEIAAFMHKGIDVLV